MPVPAWVWMIALVVATPILLAAGMVYSGRRQNHRGEPAKSKPLEAVPENRNGGQDEAAA
ncbi:MAG: hypothetical protein HYY50_00385 [Candidatus Kerfeldbacteria bacterium]|nr:hypothetical protein [Candidatus Kerfeldbacteria bacterium]